MPIKHLNNAVRHANPKLYGIVEKMRRVGERARRDYIYVPNGNWLDDGTGRMTFDAVDGATRYKVCPVEFKNLTCEEFAANDSVLMEQITAQCDYRAMWAACSCDQPRGHTGHHTVL